MKVFHCEDAFTLERVYRSRVSGAAGARARPIDPLTVVAPTHRLLTRLQLLTVGELGAAAGITFFVHGSLARAVLRAAGITPPRLLGEGALERLVHDAAVAAGGDLARDVARFEGFVGGLAATFRDLRDARVPFGRPDASDGLDARVWAAYGAFCEHLTKLETVGFTDTAGLLNLAARVVREREPRLGPVLHVGAFDLTAAVLDLLTALAASDDFEILTLGVAPGESFAYGRERFAAFAAESVGVACAGEGPHAGSLREIFDGGRGARDRAAAGGLASFVERSEAPTERSELELAARRALAWIGAGALPSRIAFLARTLEPYQPWIDAVMSEHGLPFETSATVPLTALPEVSVFLDSLDCIADDFPRSAFCRCLRHPLFRAFAFPGGIGAHFADLVDRFSRVHAIRGLEGFTRALERGLAGESAAAARHAAAAAEALVRLGEPVLAARGWSEFAAAALGFLDELLSAAPEDSAGVKPLTQAVAEVEPLEGVVPFPGFAEAVRWLRRRLSRARADRPGSPGGISILDYQQARGLTFDRVVLLGFHDGLVPRRGRQDPFLSDAAREELSVAVSRVLLPKATVIGEERWLFTMALGAARAGVFLTSAQRDSRGRVQQRSPFERPLARLVSGAGELVGSRCPSHPGHALAHALGGEGLLTLRQAIMAAGLLASERVAAARAAAWTLGVLDAGLDASLHHVERVDAWKPAGAGAFEFDGEIGAPGLQTFSPTGLDRVGGCPLQYFFSNVLRLEDLVDPDADAWTDARRVGGAVHEALRELYNGGIWRSGAFDAARSSLLESTVEMAFDIAFPHLREDVPAAFEWLVRQWSRAIARFVEVDARWLAELHAASVATEVEVNVELSVNGESLHVKGRVDRVVELETRGLRISDYKTGRREAADHLGATKVQRGTALQLPLYALAFEAAGRGLPSVEVLRVYPDLDRKVRSPVKALEAEELSNLRAQLAGAISTLARLVNAGKFPITLDRKPCEFCDFARACRQVHAPTRVRHAAAEALASYYTLRSEPDDGA